MRPPVCLFLLWSLFAAAAGAEPSTTPRKPVLGAWGVETRHISQDVKPGDDFYRHVDEGWLKSAAPPPGLPYANAFVDAYLRTQMQLQALVDGILAGTPPPGSDEEKIATLYRSYIDVSRRNALGLAPLQSQLDAIASIESHDDAARMMAKPFMKGLIGIGVSIDAQRPQRYVVTATQSGLGLPGREYYLATEEPFAGHRTAYLEFIADVFRRAGMANGEDRARKIMALETEIAAAHWSPAEMRDPVRSYNLMSIDALQAYAPGLDWSAYLAAADLGRAKEVVLETDSAVQKLARVFAATDVDTLKSYLALHYIVALAPALSEEWEKARFDFFVRRLGGVPEQQSLNNRALDFLSGEFGEVLGRAYARTYFPQDYREQMNRLVANLRTAFRARLEANDWMDGPTRAEAIRKLDAIVSHVGYPDRWRDFSSVEFAPDDLVGNLRRVAAFERADAVKALGEPRRDWHWPFPAMEINAGYSPQMNSITFPAGILQSPFFDPFADPAVNYGSIGAVIGHELGHAFDDQGSQSDATGALRNWWSPASRAEFGKRADVLVQQYNAYSPLEGVKINGALTLGENIGDLGGLTIAYDAYQMHVRTENDGKAPVIDGFSGEQRFFLAWAQLWRDYTTPAMQRQNLLTDPHSPGEFRANGTVRNFGPWYTAFNVGEGDRMYLAPDKRVRIW